MIDPTEDCNPVYDYLCVDDFMHRMIDARALATAFEVGIIDDLMSNRPAHVDDVSRKARLNGRTAHFLIDLLIANNVLEMAGETLTLTSRFLKALQFRDLMEAKLAFSNFVAPDFTDYFTALLVAPGEFQQRTRIFHLFAYQRCFDSTPENHAHARKWMQLTTALTKYEAPVCMQFFDFGPCRRMLDVGGNSGEFALQICRRYPAISATVLDLPVVCDVGQSHVRSRDAADRIAFHRANALQDPWPQGFDLITFKSMLHDWPDAQTATLIARAYEALASGGTILIFERGPFKVQNSSPPYSITPFLLFLHAYRSPQTYQTILEGSGFENIHIQRIELEMPFYLICAQKR